MGQGSSQPNRQAETNSWPSRRPSVFRRVSQPLVNEEEQQDGLLAGQSNQGRSRPRLRTRPGSVHRLSQLLHPSTTHGQGRHEPSRGSEMLQRTRSTFREAFGRSNSSQTRATDGSGPLEPSMQHRASYVRTGGVESEDASNFPPRLPSIDLTSSFEPETFNMPHNPDSYSLARSSSSNRRSTPRLHSLRPDRTFRNLSASLRRRRSPPMNRGEGGADDHAAYLSRLLSVAAHATAATLMGRDPHGILGARSLADSTGVGDVAGVGEDGSFDGFLRALQNGRIASALRSEDAGEMDANGESQSPLNFFRMFRFGASTAGDVAAGRMASTQPMADEETSDANGRMVPIIIVSIRSIPPGSASETGTVADDLPPFFEALGSLPSALPANALDAAGQDSIDAILRPSQNDSSFRSRRRASLGAFGMQRSRLSDRTDDQRDQRSPDRRRHRPWSVASSSSALEPRPPPATPASPSPELSRISSRNSTPGHSRPPSIIANSMRDFGGDSSSRRNSALHRISGASPLSSHTEETSSLRSAHSSTNLLSSESDAFTASTHRRSETSPNIHYPRFASGHPRRNGRYMEDSLPEMSRTSTSNETERTGTDSRASNSDSRSWIIYVLGGSYPENHPILTTPSLFTENPTYEDMMLLSALLGPAKAPVASEDDIQSAGGLYNISLLETGTELTPDAAKTANLVATAIMNGDDRIELEPGQRCLVCLCDFEDTEVTRKLVKCQHLYHQECIDQVSRLRRESSKL